MSIKKIIKSRRIKHPKIGDYVFLSRWKDTDPNDPFFVGFLEWTIEDENGKRFRCVGSHRFFSNCWRITQLEGKQILELYSEKKAGGV